MANKKIRDLPLLTTLDGSEILPTGGKGDYGVTINSIVDYTQSKNNWKHENYQIDVTDLSGEIQKLEIVNFQPQNLDTGAITNIFNYTIKCVNNGQETSFPVGNIELQFATEIDGVFYCTLSLNNDEVPVSIKNNNVIGNSIPKGFYAEKAHIMFYMKGLYEEVLVQYQLVKIEKEPTNSTYYPNYVKFLTSKTTGNNVTYPEMVVYGDKDKTIKYGNSTSTVTCADGIAPVIRSLLNNLDWSGWYFDDSYPIIFPSFTTIDTGLVDNETTATEVTIVNLSIKYDLFIEITLNQSYEGSSYAGEIFGVAGLFPQENSGYSYSDTTFGQNDFTDKLNITIGRTPN